MGTIVEPARAGAHGFDTNVRITRAKAAEFKAGGFAFAVRYLSRSATPPAHDLTKSEVAGILDAGLALMAVQHVARAGWTPSAELGREYGVNAAAHAKAVELPAGSMIFLDLEDVSGAVAPDAVIAYCNQWYDAVKTAGYVPGIYVGSNCGLTPDQLYHRLKMTCYWKSGSNVPAIPHRGWSMVQSYIPNDSYAGIAIDRNVVTPDNFGGTPLWIRAVGQIAANPAQPGPAPLAADAGDGEAVLRRLASEAGVSPGMERLLAYRRQNRPGSNPRYWAVVNFDLHSAKPRMFLFDRVAGTVTGYLCAHGIGSEGPTDDGYANKFSNVDGSKCSSLGIYSCADTYFGGNGRSLYLDGLEATNSAARHRHVVIHGAKYVSPDFARRYGRIGRSEGCPAVERQHNDKVIDALRGGSLMILWKSPA